MFQIKNGSTQVLSAFRFIMGHLAEYFYLLSEETWRTSHFLSNIFEKK